jgi:uncharacterized membrane protein (UPF0127 family)
MSRILIQDENNTILVEKLIIAESTPARMKGLLGRTSLSPDTGMLLRPCRSIHMWGMRFAIDAAFLDHDLTILKIVRNLKPWQLAFAPTKTHCVLETASGGLDNLNKGNRLSIEPT